MGSVRRTLFAGLIVALALGALASTAVADTGTAPSIASVSVSNITEHDATLESQIETNGLQASYQFQLGKECYPAECLVIVEIPLPVENLSSAQGEQSVSLDLNSAGVTLQPDSKYDYSVVATNSVGETQSEANDEGGIFTTPPEGTAPKTPEEPLPSGAQSGAAAGDQSAGSPALFSSPPAAVDLTSAPAPAITKPQATGSALKLLDALRACRHKPQKRRSDCERQARKDYGPTGRAKGSSRKNDR